MEKTPFTTIDELADAEKKPKSKEASFREHVERDIRYWKKARKDIVNAISKNAKEIDSLVDNLEKIREQYKPKRSWRKIAAWTMGVSAAAMLCCYVYKPQIQQYYRRASSAIEYHVRGKEIVELRQMLRESEAHNKSLSMRSASLETELKKAVSKGSEFERTYHEVSQKLEKATWEAAKSQYERSLTTKQLHEATEQVKSMKKQYEVLSKAVPGMKAVKLQVQLPEYYYFPTKDETLASIAQLVAGDMSRWPTIYQYNSMTCDRVTANQPIRIPAHIVRSSAMLHYGTIEGRVHRLRENETLATLSKKLYGSVNQASYIMLYNKRINPRFSPELAAQDYVLLPPK